MSYPEESTIEYGSLQQGNEPDTNSGYNFHTTSDDIDSKLDNLDREVEHNINTAETPLQDLTQADQTQELTDQLFSNDELGFTANDMQNDHDLDTDTTGNDDSGYTDDDDDDDDF